MGSNGSSSGLIVLGVPNGPSMGTPQPIYDVPDSRVGQARNCPPIEKQRHPPDSGGRWVGKDGEPQGTGDTTQ